MMLMPSHYSHVVPKKNKLRNEVGRRGHAWWSPEAMLS